MSDWKEYKLGEICEVTSSKRIFYSEYVSSGVPFYRSKEIIDLYNKRDISTELFISDEKYYNIKNKFGVPKPDDILLTSVGSLGIPYKVKLNDKFYFKDGNITWFRNFDKKLVNPDYLIYWLGSRIGIQKLDEITIGSTQAALTISGLKTISLTLPSLEEQRTIAGVLGTLDDKIDLLNRQNQTLESMAEALFRHYFFDNSADKIEDVQLGEVVETMSGGTPFRKKSQYYTNGTINWIKSKELIGTYIFETEEMITEEALSNSSAKYIPASSILIAMYGANVGEYGITAKPMTCNQAICALIPNKAYPFTYLYLWTKTMKPEFINLSCGAAQQNISQIVIRQQYVCGDRECVSNFHNTVVHYFDKIKSNQSQILTITKLRDSLLTKLMSNEINL